MERLRHRAAGRPPQVEHVQDIDAWNQAHVKARRDQPWEEVWADFHAAREALIGVWDGMSQADLTRLFRFPWGQEGTPYQWLCIYVDHDREHSEGLRSAMEARQGQH